MWCQLCTAVQETSDWGPWRYKSLQIFETSCTLVPVTRRHIPKDFSLQQHRYENHASSNFSFSDTIPHDPSLPCCSYRRRQPVCTPALNLAELSDISYELYGSISQCCCVWRGHAVAQLWHCATSRKVAGSIPDNVTEIFHWHNPSGRTMALGLTQPLTEMSTSNIYRG